MATSHEPRKRRKRKSYRTSTSTPGHTSMENTCLTLKELNLKLKEESVNKNTLKRTPRAATSLKRAAGRPRNPRQSVMYEKVVSVRLVGSDPEKIQRVAQAIKIAGSSHEHVIGTKTNRKVTFTEITKANKPVKIFDGCVE